MIYIIYISYNIHYIRIITLYIYIRTVVSLCIILWTDWALLSIFGSPMFNTWNVGSSGAPEMWWPEMSSSPAVENMSLSLWKYQKSWEIWWNIKKYHNIRSIFDYLCIYLHILQILNLTCPMYFHQMTGFACQATKMARRRVTP